MDDIIVPELQNVDTTLIIDPDTRTIDAGSDFLLGVETDNDAERVKFQCPKIVGDNLDLSQYHIYIHYQNAKGEKGKYLCEDIEDGGENITFSWLLSQKAVLYKGQTKFLVCAKKTQEETIVWNTTLANGNVLEGLDVDEDIVQQNDDVIEQILLKLEQIEASGGIDEETLNQINRNTEDISKLSDEKVDKQDGYSMVTDTEKQAWNSKSNFSGNYEDLANKPTIPTKTSQLDNDSEFSTFSGSYNDLSDKPTIPNEYTLPIATPTTLGGVKPIAKTDEMTQEVGVDELGGLFTKEGGSSGDGWVKLIETTVEEDVQTVIISEDMNGNSIDCDELEVFYNFVGTESNTVEKPVEVKILNNKNKLNTSYLTKIDLQYAQRKSGSVASHTSTKFVYDETNNITVGSISGYSGSSTIGAMCQTTNGLNTIIGIRLWAYTEYIGKGTSIIAYGKKR